MTITLDMLRAADRVLELINSQPRTPSREEIAKAIRGQEVASSSHCLGENPYLAGSDFERACARAWREAQVLRELQVMQDEHHKFIVERWHQPTNPAP